MSAAPSIPYRSRTCADLDSPRPGPPKEPPAMLGAPRRQLRSGKEFRAYALDFSLDRTEPPPTTYDSMPVDWAYRSDDAGAAESEAEFVESDDEFDASEEGSDGPDDAPTGSEGEAPASGSASPLPPTHEGLPGARTPKRARSDESGSENKAGAQHLSHRQRKKLKTRIKRGEAGMDARRAAFVESAFLWDACMVTIASLPHATTAFIGMVGPSHDGLHGPRMKRLFALADRGYRYFADDLARPEAPLLSVEQKVFALLVSWPNDWEKTADGAAEALRACLAELNGKKTKLRFRHRRGKGFAQVTTGITHGMGTERPRNYDLKTKTIRKAIAKLLQNKHILAILRFLEGPFRTWFPRHHAAYRSWLDFIEKQDPSLQRPYPDSSFASVTFNLGPQTVCDPHRDQSNVAGGICADVGLGRYNHQYGGHLILHEAMAIIELRPGRMAMFPSAAITHENIPIAEDEDRMGLTTHFAGGVAQHIAQGSKTQAALESSAPGALHQLYSAAACAQRWEDAIGMFMTLEELKNHWKPASHNPT